MITTRSARLVLRKDGEDIAASRIMLASRASGAYLEADMSASAAVDIGTSLEAFYIDDSGSEHLLSTVTVYALPKSDSELRAFASDPYRTPLQRVVPTAAWRKAKATEIAEDVFSACDVEDYEISALDGIELPHFSYCRQNGWTILKSLIHTVNAMQGSELAILPSTEGVLQIGETADLVSGYGTATLEASDFIDYGQSRMTAHLVGLLYGQRINANGTERTVTACEMEASASERRTVIWT